MAKNNESARKLTEKQEKIIPLMLSARSVEEGCRKARISKTTWYGWLKTPTFAAEYQKQRRGLVEAAFNELRGSAEKAAKTLVKLLESRRESIRQSTALGIVDRVLKIVEIEDIQERLDRLEERLHGENRA